jgi:hypothetical protein
MKKRIIFTCLLAMPFFVQAQLVDPAIAKKYSSAIVAQVYQATLNTQIPYAVQGKLADILYKRDSLVADAVKNDGSLRQIKSIIDSFHIQFNGQFTGEYKIRHQTFLHKSFIEGTAKADAAFVQQKYGAGTETQNNLYNLAKSRQFVLLKAATQLGTAPTLADSTYKAINLADSMYTSFIAIAKGETYFNGMLQELNKVKPFSPTEAECLQKTFKTQCFKRGDDYHANFNVAMQSCIKDTGYFKVLYEDSIKSLAAKRSRSELYDYIYKYNLVQQDIDSIQPIIYSKVRRNIWLDVKHPFNRLRDSLQNIANETAWLRIKNKLIRNGYFALGSSRISNAMRQYKILKLSPGQLDTLSKFDLEIDLLSFGHKMATRGSMPNFVPGMERELLKQSLREGQLDTLIYYEALMQATANAKNDWSRIAALQLAPAADSAATIKILTGYHRNWLVLNERYKSEPGKYKALLNSAVQAKPPVLKAADEAESKTAADRLKILW